MNEPTIHARDFDLRYNELDRNGEALPTTMLNLLEDTACTHCDESGWSVYRLLSEGYGWILLRGGMEMSRYPRRGEGVRVETWTSDLSRWYGTREFRIRTDSGERLGWARSLWLFYSLERKRPVPIFGDIVERWAPEGTRAGDMSLDEVGFPEPPSGPRFAVRRSDIDTNGHVNNVNYLAWALEAVPEATTRDCYLASIRGQFRREVTYSSSVSAALAPDDSGGLMHGVFADNAEGSYLAAAARSRWLPRAGQESAGQGVTAA